MVREPGEERKIVAEDVDRYGRQHEKEGHPHAPIVMRPFPVWVRVMLNTLAGGRSVLVRTVFDFIHRYSHLTGGQGSRRSSHAPPPSVSRAPLRASPDLPGHRGGRAPRRFRRPVWRSAV